MNLPAFDKGAGDLIFDCFDWLLAILLISASFRLLFTTVFLFAWLTLFLFLAADFFFFFELTTAGFGPILGVTAELFRFFFKGKLLLSTITSFSDTLEDLDWDLRFSDLVCGGFTTLSTTIMSGSEFVRSMTLGVLITLSWGFGGKLETRSITMGMELFLLFMAL